jgi:hypothetical protein
MARYLLPFLGFSHSDPKTGGDGSRVFSAIKMKKQGKICYNIDG